MTREEQARNLKAAAIVEALLNVGVAAGKAGADIVRGMTDDQWRMAAQIAGKGIPSAKTKERVYALFEEHGKAVHIDVQANYQDYSIIISRAGSVISKEIVQPHQVVKERNRLINYWTQRADAVTAAGIPELAAMRRKKVQK